MRDYLTEIEVCEAARLAQVADLCRQLAEFKDAMFTAGELAGVQMQRIADLEARLAVAERETILSAKQFDKELAKRMVAERERDEARGKLHACESSRQSWMRLATEKGE